LANLNLDQSQLKHRRRLLQLAEALSLLRQLPCENLLVTRNFDYTVAFSPEEADIIRDKGFKESLTARD
jgi:hypothetical protein